MGEDFTIKGSGPYRGVGAREYEAIRGQFRHLMNCLPTAGGLFTRFGTAHDGQAASIKSTLQNDRIMIGYHDDTDHRIVRHMVIRWGDHVPEYDQANHYKYPVNTIARFIWSHEPHALALDTGILWMQLKTPQGIWMTSHGFSEFCPDDPNIQTVMLNNTQYFCSGYGPLWRIDTQITGAGAIVENIYEVKGVDRNAATPVFTIPYIMGPLPNPIAIEVVKSNVLAFIGVRNGDSVLKTSSQLPAPDLATPEKQAGGSLNLGTPYYFRVTMIDDYGVESKGSNEVTYIPLPGLEIDGFHRAVFTEGKSCKLSWLSVPHGKLYRIYVGLAPDVYFDHFFTDSQSFIYGGQAGEGARGCPTISGPMQTQYGKLAPRTVCFFDPQTATDGNELALKAENFCVIKCDKPEDVNNALVAGAEAFGGLVVYARNSITHLPLGGVIDPAINPFEPLDLAQGTGLASTRARVNVKGREYFIDGCGKGVFMLPGAQAPVEVSTTWSVYFEGVSQSGIDPFNPDDARLKYAHACDDSKAGQILFFLPMGNSNHRMVDCKTEFVGVYRYENVIPQRKNEATDWWAFFGKGAYYDSDGWVNLLEYGYAYSSADILNDGNGGKTMYLGGYGGYSSTPSVDFMDAVQNCVILNASTTAPPNPVTTVRFNLNDYPGLKQRNDHVGAWMEMIDNLEAGTPPVGVCVNDQRRLIVAVRDVYWNNCDVAWTAWTAGTDSMIIGAPTFAGTDGIDGRGCERVTLKNPPAVAGTNIAYSSVVSTALGAGNKIRVWLKLKWTDPAVPPFGARPAGILQFWVGTGFGAHAELWDVPELQNDKWTECLFTVTAPHAGIIEIGICTKAGGHVDGDLLFIDQVDLQGERYVDYDLASPFVDKNGTVATPTVKGETVRIYWDINDRRMIVLGADSPADAEILWKSFTAKYRCAGEQSVRAMYTAEADGFDPMMLVMGMPRSDVPMFGIDPVTGAYNRAPPAPWAPGTPIGTPVMPPNHLPDATLELIENLYAYWSWSTIPGHNDVRAETLWFNSKNYGGVMYILLECQDRGQFAFYSYIGRGEVQRLKGK